jgi:CRP/FNR family transcriptional regulator, cyclic AMP receptor protein
MPGDRLLVANQRRGEFAVYPAHVRLARVLAELAKTCSPVSGAGITLGSCSASPSSPPWSVSPTPR